MRDKQSVRSRLALRNRLKCNDFRWYLNHVWPENFFPAPDRFFGKVVKQKGETSFPLIEYVLLADYSQSNRSMPRTANERCWGFAAHREAKTGCLRQTVVRPAFMGGHLEHDAQRRAHSSGKVIFNLMLPKEIPSTETHVQSIFSIMSDESICLDNIDGDARAMACSGMSRQLWYHNLRTNAIVHGNTGLCLSLAHAPEPSGGVSARTCDGSSEQQWTFESVPWH